MRKHRILETVLNLAPPEAPMGATTEEIANVAGVLRQNTSGDLNELSREGLVRKSSGRPVRYWATEAGRQAALALDATPPLHSRDGADVRHGLQAVLDKQPPSSFADIIGAEGSLRMAVEQAQAAMLYPPRGLPTLIVGPTGAGKSHLAEVMYQYAVQSGRLPTDAPFHVFNCADYAANPQLLLAQLFGYVKGSFTGADKTTPGLIAQTENGVLFLDEIHRLPPEGQEMLFLLMDRGVYRMLGDGAEQRKASITLIAATSEDPRSALLNTLLRRFPVVITVPELNVRPLEERLTLVELFLRDEATRVGVPISVSPLVLVALLTFRTVGNVGELRSAVLLGCAKAFLGYIASGNNSRAALGSAPTSGAGPMPLYLTHLAPEIQLDYLRNHLDTPKAELIVGVEDRLYLPAQDHTHRQVREEDTTLDLYSELRRRMDGYLDSGLDAVEVQKLIQIDVDYYLRRLRGGAGGTVSTSGGTSDGASTPGAGLSQRFLSVVADFVQEAGKELGYVFGPEVVTGLALHLASAPRSEGGDIDGTMALVAHCPREYGVVRRLAHRLQTGLETTLSAGEISFLALFLAAHERPAESPGISVVVMCHGEHTASSMADVANQLLGENRVVAVDMPLHQSVDDTMQRTIQRVKEAGNTNGVLLLVDMGSLTAFAPTIERAVGIPVAVVPLVTTAAVIEAGRLAGRGDMDLPHLVQAVRQVYNVDVSSSLPEEGKRVIITTCLTGQGTARKLAAFLTESIPVDLRDHIVVQAVDLENGSEIPELLVEGWRGTVIAAAGTVNPRLPGVTFIGMEQILFGDGMTTLVSLAEKGKVVKPSTASFTRDEAIALATRFVTESIDGNDGRRFAQSATQALHRLEAQLDQPLSPSQAARWVIHFAFAVERLITDELVADCNEMDDLVAHHSVLLEAIDHAVSPVVEPLSIDFPPGEIGFLAQIVLSA